MGENDRKKSENIHINCVLKYRFCQNKIDIFAPVFYRILHLMMFCFKKIFRLYKYCGEKYRERFII